MARPTFRAAVGICYPYTPARFPHKSSASIEERIWFNAPENGRANG